MRIRSMRLESFRNFSRLELPFTKRVTVLHGANGSGKSTVLAAVEYALFARCSWTDGLGRGAEQLIHHGSSSSEIILDVEELGDVRRRILRDGKAPSATTAARSGVLHRLGINPRLARIAMGAGRVIGMKVEEQQEFLAEVLTLEFGRDRLRNGVMWWADTQKLPSAILLELLEALLPDDWPGGLSALRALLRQVQEQLRMVRRELKVMPDTSSVGTDLGEWQRRLQEARQARDCALALARSLEERSEIEHRLSMLGENQDPAPQMEVARTTHQAALRHAEELRAQSKVLKERLAQLGQWAGCPVLETECPVMAPGKLLEVRLGVAGELEATLAQYHEATTEQGRELVALREQEEQVARHRDQMHLRERLQERLDELPPPEATRTLNLSSIEREIAEIETRVAQALSAGAVDEAKRSRLYLAEVAWQQLQQAIQAIRTMLLRKAVQPLEERINHSLMRIWPGSRLILAGDEEVSIMVERGGSVFNPTQLSTSEQLRCGVAIAHALGGAAGLGILCVDNVDALDPVNQRLLLGLLVDLSEDYGNILVAMAGIPPQWEHQRVQFVETK